MADTVTLRNGSVLRVVPFTQDDIRELCVAMANQDNMGALAIVARAIPDATPADHQCLKVCPSDAVTLVRMATGENLNRFPGLH